MKKIVFLLMNLALMAGVVFAGGQRDNKVEGESGYKLGYVCNNFNDTFQTYVVIRWLMTDPNILLLDVPTRGIDVGAKAEIHALINRLAWEGKTIFMVSG